MSNTIIVGNGTSILDYENGEKIDSFQHVVRFNSYKTFGYEKYTGIKTNILFTVSLYHIKDIHLYDRVVVHNWLFSKEEDEVYQAISKIRNCEKTTKETIDKIPCKDPSTGLIAIYMLLEDNVHTKPLYLTGFDWWEREAHHYGDNELRGNLHKPKEEYKVLTNLIENKLIKFL